MKVNTKTDSFKPITIEITLETEAEARDMYCIMNWSPIVENVCFRPRDIRDALENGRGRLVNTADFQRWAVKVETANGATL